MDLSLWALFSSAFISSTLFPGGSEAVLAYLSSSSNYSPELLLLVASIGNTLGGLSSWGLGRIIAWKYPLQELKPAHQRAFHHLQRWGTPVLFLSWLPVVGDPLCLVAGWLKMNFFLSLVFIALGKTLRYAVIIFVSG
ncbi:MAG: DedA family protein [Gammaproteobacteria bacterium]|nr:DedA family protein [Gammaproteobacteria bacterium]